MEEYYFEMQVSNSKVLCIGPITGREAASEDLGSGLGYYLYTASAADPKEAISVLAHFVSEEAAHQMARTLDLRVDLKEAV